MKTKKLHIVPSPFLFTRPTVSTISLINILSLIPILIMLGFDRDFKAISIVSIAIFASYASEFCVTHLKFSYIPERLSFIFDGMLIGLLLPNSISFLLVFLSAFFGCFFAKYIHGGKGSYWIHPVAVSIVIAFINGPNLFTSSVLNTENIKTIENFFEILKVDNFAIGAIDSDITNFLNNTFFSMAKIKLPEGYITLFWRSPSAIPAVRYNLLILLSSIILIASRSINSIIPFFFMFVYGLFVYIFALVPFGLPLFLGDIFFSFFTSGVFFIAFYILPDYSILPKTTLGKIVGSFLSGLIAFLFCGPGGLAIGAVFTVLLVSVLNMVIEYVENSIYQRN